jgi:hypothetical protein
MKKWNYFSFSADAGLRHEEEEPEKCGGGERKGNDRADEWGNVCIPQIKERGGHICA